MSLFDVTEIISVSSIEEPKITKRSIENDLNVSKHQAEVIHSKLKTLPPKYRPETVKKIKEIGFIPPNLITGAVVTGVAGELSKRLFSLLWPKKTEIGEEPLSLMSLQRKIGKRVAPLKGGRCHIASIMAQNYLKSYGVPATILKGDVYMNGKRVIKNHAFLVIMINGTRYLYDPTIKLFIPALPILHPVSGETNNHWVMTGVIK